MKVGLPGIYAIKPSKVFNKKFDNNFTSLRGGQKQKVWKYNYPKSIDHITISVKTFKLIKSWLVKLRPGIVSTL